MTFLFQSSANIKKVKPKEGQESCWDYPRPPRVEKEKGHITIVFNGVKIVDTKNAYRVLETSHPPTYYMPQKDIQMKYLSLSDGRSTVCEFKGSATYYDVKVGNKTASKCCWLYANPDSTFKIIKGYLAFYAGKMDYCTLDGEKVKPQEGNFYGGWISSKVVGPFKGGSGTWGW